ncbi:MAG: DUF2087 domain-containing protein [Velocimicrobium sp.]
MGQKVDETRNYSEKEVNSICEKWHTFGDYFILRRELIDNGLLCRVPNGSRYWKPKLESKKEEAYPSNKTDRQSL